MAAPTGYPPMGQMPMGGAPMGGPPMGPGGPGMPMQGRPMRRGTSKAVPIVVSAGLAVGVFCGLLFGVGKTSDEAVAAPSTGTNAKPKTEEPKPDPGGAPAGLGATAARPVAQGSAAPATGSAAPAAGSAAPAAGSAAPPAPTIAEVKTVKLIIQVKPDGAAKDAKISVDGKELEGTEAEVPADKKSVKLEIKSSGYRTREQKIDIVTGTEMTIEIEMQKRPSGGGVRPPKRPDKPPGGGGGGLIDI